MATETKEQQVKLSETKIAEIEILMIGGEGKLWDIHRVPEHRQVWIITRGGRKNLPQVVVSRVVALVDPSISSEGKKIT